MNHAHKTRRAASTKGFTLVELILALSFISGLLLAISVVIINIGATYNRGITLKEVNQTARGLSDEFTRTFSSSSAFVIDTASPINKYFTTSAGGRLCTNQYTYLWNTAKAQSLNDPNLIRNLANPDDLSTHADDVIKGVRLVKLPDAGAFYCQKDGTGRPLNKDIRAIDAPNAVELLKSGDRTLSLQQLSVTSGAADTLTGQQLYGLNFTIGSGAVSALNADQTACLPPGNPNSDFNYCTVQQFYLVLRAGNRTS